MKSKIWTPPKSIPPPKLLAVVAHEVGVEIKAEAAATAPLMAMVNQDLNVPAVLRAGVEEDDRKRVQIVQKVHELRAATILSNWTNQITKDVAEEEINVMIRRTILMTATTASL